MKPTRKLTRRSFLGRVAGGVVGGAALLATGAQEAEALQVTDRDTGANSDPVGRGYTGYSDSDSGRSADRANHGRRGRRSGGGIQGCSDNDRGSNSDPAGRGRGNGASDNDSGQNSDPAGCGRR
ncbi:MAG: hypothetical protein JWL74_1883 [Alphaproteobacteria bacterium]|nr:hypothetical protein [Alphaproteobacteria bacterium]